MATPKGLFDGQLTLDGWFDETSQAAGWFDGDLVDVATTPGLVLSTAEASDAAAFNVQEGFGLAATEDADAISFSIGTGANLALTATEGADVLSGTIAIVAIDLDMAASEAADNAAFVFADVTMLMATENADTFAGTADAASGGADLDLAASEDADVASIAMAQDIDLPWRDTRDGAGLGSKGPKKSRRAKDKKKKQPQEDTPQPIAKPPKMAPRPAVVSVEEVTHVQRQIAKIANHLSSHVEDEDDDETLLMAA